MLALVLSALLWVAAQPAQAQTVADCQAKIDALRVQTENATFLGQNADKNRAGLLNKLNQASIKLDEGKNLDAIQKLTDFQTTVSALNAQGKINSDDAQKLLAGAADAIACIRVLDATAAA